MSELSGEVSKAVAVSEESESKDEEGKSKEKKEDAIAAFGRALQPFVEALGRDESSGVDVLMKPVKEMILKAFHRPEQLEERVHYVMEQVLLLLEETTSDVVIRCLGQYLALTLPPSWLDNMCRFMMDRIELIIRTFLNFKHYFACHFLPDDKRARLFVLQCALHRRFPLLVSEGCKSLARCPVFYGTKESSLFKASQGQQSNERTRAAWELLQTPGSFKTIPSRHKESLDHPFPTLTMDLRTLEQEVQRDVSRGKLPCVVIASHNDDLHRIREICDVNGLWLHVEGGSSSLLLAASSSLPKATHTMMTCADSISCQPFHWFTHRAFESLDTEDSPRCSSTLTFIRETPRDSPPPCFGFSDADFCQIFPLWHLLVTRSVRSIKARVDHALALCAHLKTQLAEHKNMFATATGPGPSVPHVVFFQVVPQSNQLDLSAFRLDTNAFNYYLIQSCSQELNRLHMVGKIYQEQTCMVFDPLFVKSLTQVKLEHINQFVQKIVVEINILRKCLAERKHMQDVLESLDLEWVEPAHVNALVTLASFRFVPPYISSDLSSDSVSILNKALVDELEAERKGGFSLAADIHGYPVICINPGNLIFQESQVESIGERIANTLKHMTFPQDVMQEMADTIQQGIESAEKEVQDEVSLEYHPDTILRKIPLVGSVYGWLLPAEQATVHAGRSFDMITKRLHKPEHIAKRKTQDDDTLP